MGKIRVWIALLLAFSAADCGKGLDPLQGWPNILLISLDALRADHLSCYGYGRETSPFLDELAGRGVRFANAYINANGTPPSHTTILSSLYQETHRVGFLVDGKHDYSVPSGVVMLQELLLGQGYQTLAVADNGYMSAEYGFPRGFEEYDDEYKGVKEGSRRLVEKISARLGGRRPIFAFFHTYEIHSPYRPPEEYRDIFGVYESDFEPINENLVPVQHSAGEHLGEADFQFLESQYDAGIRYTDDVLRSLFDRLAEIGFLDNALVVVTSDHGEEFGEHGGLLHGRSLYEEVMRVPLIFQGAGVERGGVDERLASSIDIVPTILGRLGLRPRTPVAGIDLFSEEMRSPDRPVFAQFNDFLYVIRTPRWKLVENKANGVIELYDLIDDPEERNNLAEEKDARVRNLRSRLERWRSRVLRLDLERSPVTPPAELVERLRSLGYVQ